jgi:hypothetical protein
MEGKMKGQVDERVKKESKSNSHKEVPTPEEAWRMLRANSPDICPAWQLVARRDRLQSKDKQNDAHLENDVWEMEEEINEHEVERLLDEYVEIWHEVDDLERLLEQAEERWSEAEDQLFRKRSTEHCKIVVKLLRERMESGPLHADLDCLAEEIGTWIESRQQDNQSK